MDNAEAGVSPLGIPEDSIVFDIDPNVTGNGSAGNTLAWFADRSDSDLPAATAWSLPLWIYKVLILAWALWLSFALLRWLPWMWRSFVKEGFWHSRKGDDIDAAAGTK